MGNFQESGYEIVSGLFTAEEIEKLRIEADRVASEANSVCVRHLSARSEVFRKLSLSEKLLNLIPEGLISVRSILFDKTPDQNWPVLWHQDLTIAVSEKTEVEGYGPWSVKEGVIHVQPSVALLERMVTLRIHLDETSAGNGALKVIPGSHRRGRISPDSIRDLVPGSEVVCECTAGDVLLMSPLILHASNRSRIPTRRRVIHVEYAPVEALAENLTWHESPSSES